MRRQLDERSRDQVLESELLATAIGMALEGHEPAIQAGAFVEAMARFLIKTKYGNANVSEWLGNFSLTTFRIYQIYEAAKLRADAGELEDEGGESDP